ncbi:hypothetical protein [Teredinibacter turnerae]|uniref:hypothetical protein n=1 Tax=Teredinibacter turnerae TaxID=2426 RepID=UPI0030D33E8F
MKKLFLALAALPTLNACVFVSPKTRVIVDQECGTATAYATLAPDPTPGQGLVILQDRSGGNLPATVGECGGDECKAVLFAIGRQLVVETVATVGYVLAHNAYADAARAHDCKTKTQQVENAGAPRKIMEEDLGDYL